jgi:Peptidase M50B-like
VKRAHQGLLIVSVLLGSWLGMQAVHEAGHVLGATLSGGRVVRVVLHPLTISRTDLSENPHPLAVAWVGPLAGVLLPLLFWWAASAARWAGAFALRFFAGFCLIANGAYLALGSFDGIGDAGELLRLGSPPLLLWAFGLGAVPTGLYLWHGQGHHFGLGSAAGRVRAGVAYTCLVALLMLLALGLMVGRG